MAAFIIYALRWAVTLTLLYSLFRILLQRETFHRLNRAVLLAVLMVSPLLPLIPVHTEQPTTFDVVLTHIEEPLLRPSSSETVSQDMSAALDNDEAASGLWVRYCAYIYIIGIAVSLVTYLFRLLTLMRHLRRCRRISHPSIPSDVHLLLDMGATQPCSWMRWIIMGPMDLKQNAEPILRHELAHVSMRHSWDLLLCDLTCCLLWCLPFAWMLRQDLVGVHEFQADEAVLRGGVTQEDYEHLLVRKAVQCQTLPIMNTLRRGALKKRFAMMYRRRSSRWTRLRLLYLVPALAACIWVSARAEEYGFFLNGTPISNEEVKEISPSSIQDVVVLRNSKRVMIRTASETKHTELPKHEEAQGEAEPATDEQMPQFPGGKGAMQQYISKHVRYPQAAIEKGVTGTVIADFFIEADGRVTNVNATYLQAATDEGRIKGIACSQGNTNVSESDMDRGIRALQEQTVELIQGMPRFEPARRKGRAVRQKMELPITFGLN